MFGGHYPKNLNRSLMLFPTSFLSFTVKGVLFLIIWTLTFGKHHFWLLPNLTEDVGFFASFVPLYEHKSRDDIMKETEKPKKTKPAKESKKKRKAQEEPSDLKEEHNGTQDEANNRSEGEEEAKQEQTPQEEGSESSENEKFEIVDDKDLPPILKLDL